jgi:tRNA A-37 threonylcarbamoyl transferase component Bud32
MTMLAVVAFSLLFVLLLALTWHRRGGALLPLAAAVVALAPLAIVEWLGAAWARRRLTSPARVRRSLEAAGLGDLIEGCAVSAQRIAKGRMNAVLIVTLTPEAGEPRTLVLKHLLRFGTLLGWAARTFGATREYPDRQDATARTVREVRALLRLARWGFPTPRCLGFSLREQIIAMEYVEGLPLAEQMAREPALVAQLGALLARMHAHDYSTGDANPENMLVDANGRIIPLDFEQSLFGAEATCARKGFDLAWAGAFLATDEDRARLAAAYGGYPAPLAAAVRSARAHLDRFFPIVEWYGRRWRAPGLPIPPAAEVTP